MSSGIYQIRNSLSGKRYVGSAVNLRKRQREHFNDLRQQQHRNQHLQRAFDKYGEGAFAFSVLERIEDTARLIPREQHYLDMLKPEYNIAQRAGSTLGCHPSLETRRKMSEAKKGKPLSKQHRKNISLALSGERNPNYGRCFSVETRHKLSVAHMGRSLSPVARRKISEALMGKPFTAIHRKHLSEAANGKSHPHKGHPLSAVHRKHLSEALKAYWRRIRIEKETQDDKARQGPFGPACQTV